MLHSDGASSVHGGSLLQVLPGDPVGEMAFFTESPCLEVRAFSTWVSLRVYGAGGGGEGGVASLYQAWSRGKFCGGRVSCCSR